MDYEYIFRKICERRGVTLSKVESVGFNTKIAFGMADGTELLATELGAFYFIDSVTLFNVVAITGVPLLDVSDLGTVSSGGQMHLSAYQANNNVTTLRGIETDYLKYRVNTHSAGSLGLVGVVYKITYV